MKLLFALLIASPALALSGFAQETAPVKDSPVLPPTAEPAAPGFSTPDHSVQLAPPPPIPEPSTPNSPAGEPSLIPEVPQTQTTFTKPPTFTQKQLRKTKTEEAEDALKQMIRFREAKTKALTDPVVQAAWQAASVAHTDYEKRLNMQHYYTALYDRIAKIDNRFPTLLAETRRLSMAHVTQSRLQPSEPPAYLPPQKAATTASR